MGLGPGHKRADNVGARQHHQMIAFRKDHQACWRSDPTDHIKDGIRVTVERSDLRLQLRRGWPHERPTRHLVRIARTEGGYCSITLSAPVVAQGHDWRGRARV